MRHDALEYLACPHCGADLHLEPVSENAGEIIAGRLFCGSKCGTYPIEDGVPRLLPDLVGRPIDARDRQSQTGRGFGTQWRMFTYGNTTWGITVEERLPVVLHELCWQQEDLGGKVILDAGCGNGTLSEALAEQGATVVAVDLSDSVARANEHCGSERLHFAQGNLFYPPFKPASFDAIYSCGVFHHTPDPRRCFRAAAPLLKNEADSRLFVWLYSKRGRLFNATVEPLMKLTRRMPSWLLVPACRTLAPPVEGLSRLFTRFGVVEYASRTLRDRAVQLHDLLSPRFVWYQDFEEASGWATELGFERVEQTDYTPPCNGPDELRTVLQTYLTVCRPGFGMLCRGRAVERTADAS